MKVSEPSGRVAVPEDVSVCKFSATPFAIACERAGSSVSTLIVSTRVSALAVTVVALLMSVAVICRPSWSIVESTTCVLLASSAYVNASCPAALIVSVSVLTGPTSSWVRDS